MASGMGAAGLALSIAIAAVAAVSPAAADDEAAPDAHDLQEVGLRDSLNLLSLDCEYRVSADGLRVDKTQADCAIVTSGVTKPSGEEIQKRLKELDSKEMREEIARDIGREDCGGWNLAEMRRAAAGERPGVPDARRRYLTLLLDACAKKSVDAAVVALRFQITEIDAHTCKMRGPWFVQRYEFKRTGPDTWQAVDQSRMSGTVVRTIWRKTNEAFSKWNLRETWTGAINCSDKRLCNPPGNNEFTWEEPKPVLECRFVVAGS